MYDWTLSRALAPDWLAWACQAANELNLLTQCCNRYRALSGAALRALRLDLLLTLIHNLQDLPAARWVCKEVQDPHMQPP